MTFKKIVCAVLILSLIVLFVIFNRPFSVIPSQIDSTRNESPKIYPDYSEVVLPFNIAPCSFKIDEEAEVFLTRIRSKNGKELVYSGKKVQIDPKAWSELLLQNKGEELCFEIFSRREGRWTAWKPIVNTISPDPIDSWVMYRLIEPGYEFFQKMGLYQRELTSYEEDAFVRNDLVKTTLCLNCHSFQDRKTDRFLFHVRNYRGGTVFVDHGKVRKIDLKAERLFSAGTYPAWHPSENLVAFSVNKTFQLFHYISKNRIEVMDSRSDLVIFDPERNEIRLIEQTDEDFETFVSWAPDGKTLYYVSAHLVLKDLQKAWKLSTNDKEGEKAIISMDEDNEFRDRFKEFQYDLMKRSFDPRTGEFGKAEKVIDAKKLDKSIVHPRISPDGRWLLFTMSNYGTFPIWHRESDLYMMDLTTGTFRSLDEVNSKESESYHTWDSSGRWFVFSSRRDDGTYTRLYFTHVDGEGRCTKPFLLPQRDPDQNINLMKSYNVPELVEEPISVSLQTLMSSVRKSNSEPVTLVPTKKDR